MTTDEGQLICCSREERGKVSQQQKAQGIHDVGYLDDFEAPLHFDRRINMRAWRPLGAVRAGDKPVERCDWGGRENVLQSQAGDKD